MSFASVQAAKRCPEAAVAMLIINKGGTRDACDECRIRISKLCRDIGVEVTWTSLHPSRDDQCQFHRVKLSKGRKLPSIRFDNP